MQRTGSKHKLMGWYGQRSLWERVVLLVCLLVALFFAWDTLVMSPISAQKNAFRRESKQLKSELKELEARVSMLQVRKDFDPDQENRQLLQRLKVEAAEMQRQLAANIDTLVSPQEMSGLLKQLLEEQKKLQLVKLENLPAETLELGKSPKEGDFKLLYRHRLKLEFVGDYFATLAYLKKLENLPRRLVWENVDIATEEYPQARVVLQVYTLSLNEGWIGG